MRGACLDDQYGQHEYDDGCGEDDENFWLSGINGQGEHQREQRDIPRPVLPPHNEDGYGEQPSCPRHDCGMRPPHPPHERTAELVDSSSNCTSDRTDSKDSSKCVRPASSYHQGHDDLNGVGQVKWEGIADD